MQLSEATYFSTQADTDYLSASQVKRFLECEALALAEIRGDIIREKTTALLVGSYVDAYFSRTIDDFVRDNPQIFTRSGDLRADFQQAQEIIAYIEHDPLLMRMLDGEQQKILTGTVRGVPFKGKLDVLLSEAECQAIAQDFPDMAEHLLMAPGAIVDMKIMRDMAPVYMPGAGRLSFVQAWRYDLQLAIYQQLVGNKLPCFLLVATKEKTPDKALIHIPQYILDAALEAVSDLLPRFHHLKRHPDEATRCERCVWCRQTKQITGAVDADELEGGGL